MVSGLLDCLDFCVFNSSDYVQMVLCHYSLLVLVDEQEGQHPISGYWPTSEPNAG